MAQGGTFMMELDLQGSAKPLIHGSMLRSLSDIEIRELTPFLKTRLLSSERAVHFTAQQVVILS